MIKIKLFGLFHVLAFFVIFLAYAVPVMATLGEPASSIESDRKAFSAVNRGTTPFKSYTVHEIYSPANTVREFVSPSGIVFGVAWNGLVPPDIAQLLGSYITEYKNALQHTPRQKGSRHQRVKSSALIVERWGHMRNLQGRAYVPALIPSGVNIDEIR